MSSADQEGLFDVVAPRPAVRDESFTRRGRIATFVVDDVVLGSAGQARREYLMHPGAVAVLALDAAGRVAMLNQYRHAVRSNLWEIPAGLLDKAGEEPLAAAQRELAEEADLVAGRWDVLVDFLCSPGITDESIRVYLARDLTEVSESERFERTEEEAEFEVRWVPLDDVVQSIARGELHSPSLLVGALAARNAWRSGAADGDGWVGLRPGNAPWPYQPGTF